MLSGTDCATILMPEGELLDIVNVPSDNPFEMLIDWIIAWLLEIIELTTKTVLNENVPAVIDANPTVSPTLRLDILK